MNWGWRFCRPLPYSPKPLHLSVSGSCSKTALQLHYNKHLTAKKNIANSVSKLKNFVTRNYDRVKKPFARLLAKFHEFPVSVAASTNKATCASLTNITGGHIVPPVLINAIIPANLPIARTDKILVIISKAAHFANLN